MSNTLEVYLGTEKVGRLWRDQQARFQFAYDEAWLAQKPLVPLSLHLPLRPEPYDDERARPFFANLLPESDLRRALARQLGLSERNDFALLEAVGGECAGAITLLPEGEPLPEKARYKPLGDAALNQIIEELPRRPMLAGEEGIRLSLAGAQNKLPVYFDGERISLPMGSAPSSHILKPSIRDYAETVQNEYFCMKLAARLGLAVPNVSLLYKQQTLYLVERYDRRRLPNGAIERVHQEDFCQALGIPPEQKYEKEGGPSLQQCFALLREYSINPVADVSALLRWVIFNYLIGNADAHAKNISLLLTERGPTLAPFYDLMCTAVYPALTDRLAMKIGTEDRPDWIDAHRWEQFADDIGINYRLVRQQLEEMKEVIVRSADDLAKDFEQEHGETKIIDQIMSVISGRSRELTNALNAGAE